MTEDELAALDRVSKEQAQIMAQALSELLAAQRPRNVLETISEWWKSSKDRAMRNNY